MKIRITRIKNAWLTGDARELCWSQTAGCSRPKFSLSLGLIYKVSLIFFRLNAKTCYL